MMMLGDVLAAARRSPVAMESFLASIDPALSQRIANEAGRVGQPVPDWIGRTVGWFELHAKGDDWATLTSRLRASSMPGDECLRVMIERRLAAAERNARQPMEGQAL